MRSNGTPATSPFPTSPYYASPPSPVPLHHHQPPAQRPYTANHGIPTQFAPGLSEARSYLGDQERPSTGEGFDSGLTTHLRGVDRTSFERSRSGSIDLDSARRAAIGSATAGSNIRPVLRVTAKAGSTVNSSPALSYPQRLPSSSSPTTSPNSAAFDNYLFWKQVPSLPPTDPTPPVLPDLNLSRPESDDFSFIPGITTPPAVPEHPTPPPQEVAPTWQSQNGSYNRSRPISQKAMLGSALEKAHMAVTLDNAGNFEGAVDAYRDACLLLGEVMSRAGGDNDRLKLQTIKDTYMERINEIRAMPPASYYDRRLPAPPQTEEYADEDSLYTVDDDHSTLVPSGAPSIIEYNINGPSRPPPRRDSLYISPDGTLGASEIEISPLSPGNRPWRDISVESEPDTGFHQMMPSLDERDSSTFGAAAMSPRFSPRKTSDAGVVRSSSDASSKSSRSFRQVHSRQNSEEVTTTSWLNTIDESGSSVGEPSPLWSRKIPSLAGNVDISDGDFDAQLDAAVEAAYDDGYVVDYAFDELESMIQSPRENVERAKERVRQIEREMEMEIQKGRERSLKPGDRQLPRRESDPDYYNDADDESEEERMLEEMTRGYTLDFDFGANLETKLTLPRESSSTQYSDTTFARGSTSSGYSSGTTWGSGQMPPTIKALSTVDETPGTPLPLLEPQPSEESEFEDIGPSTMGSLPAIPMNGLLPGRAAGRSVRNRRLSSLAEPLEPLKIHTLGSSSSLNSTEMSIPTTIIQGPSPRMGELLSPSLHTGSLSPTFGPGSSQELETDDLSPLVSQMGKPIPSITSNIQNFNMGMASSPLQQTHFEGASHFGLSSPTRMGFSSKMPGIPPLRQIHSSASLRSRNISSPDLDVPATPLSHLFSSSSASNLRKGFPKSATPTGIVATPLYQPPTAGLGNGGISLFDGRMHSPIMSTDGSDPTAATNPVPLEPCPPEPLSRPFWLMRCLYQTIAHPRGGYISTKLFVPREVWHIKGVKIKAVDEKINACDLVTAALQRLGKVKQDQVNSVFEEMQALENVLDRAQTMLSKRLGNEVGGTGARALYGESLPSEGDNNMVTTKVVGGGKSYFSLRKLRTKASNTGLGSTFGSTPPPLIANDSAYTSLPMAGSGADASQQPKRDLDSVTYVGPHAAYLASLAKLFDAAQILDRLTVFDEDALSQKVPIKLRIGLELSHRHASEFFGFFICRFVLADVTLLLDKFVKRGSEWVAQ